MLARSHFRALLPKHSRALIPPQFQFVLTTSSNNHKMSILGSLLFAAFAPRAAFAAVSQLAQHNDKPFKGGREPRERQDSAATVSTAGSTVSTAASTAASTSVYTPNRRPTNSQPDDAVGSSTSTEKLQAQNAARRLQLLQSLHEAKAQQKFELDQQWNAARRRRLLLAVHRAPVAAARDPRELQKAVLKELTRESRITSADFNKVAHSASRYPSSSSWTSSTSSSTSSSDLEEQNEVANFQ